MKKVTQYLDLRVSITLYEWGYGRHFENFRPALPFVQQQINE